MKQNNGHKPDGRPGAGGFIPPEYVIARALHSRLESESLLRAGDREAVAYRVSELMVCAKVLYTETLPRLLGEGEALAFHEELAGLRMALLHIRDLVADFDSAFLEAMLHEREGQPVDSSWLQPDEDADEELLESEEGD